MLLEKITDDLLLAEDLSTINDFVTKQTELFNVSKAISNSAINFNCCKIEQDNAGNISMNMKDYLYLINPMEMSRMMHKLSNQNTITSDYDAYKSLAENAMWAVIGTLPQHLSQLHTCIKLPLLKLHDITEANKMLKKPKIHGTGSKVQHNEGCNRQN